jgi:hypothetical protein
MKTKHSLPWIAGVVTLILVTALFSSHRRYSNGDDRSILILHSGDLQGQLDPCG